MDTENKIPRSSEIGNHFILNFTWFSEYVKIEWILTDENRHIIRAVNTNPDIEAKSVSEHISPSRKIVYDILATTTFDKDFEDAKGMFNFLRKLCEAEL